MKLRLAPLAAGLVLTLAAAGLTPVLADDDRHPTAEERAAIEAKLSALGYVSWEEIEMERHRKVWEVEDARTADGAEWDLELDPATLEVVHQDRDD